jgi:hypothetical protein
MVHYCCVHWLYFYPCLVIILNRDKLNISSELDVFKAAIMWVGHNIMHRKQHLIRLMKCVRFPFMTQVCSLALFLSLLGFNDFTYLVWVPLSF